MQTQPFHSARRTSSIASPASLGDVEAVVADLRVGQIQIHALAVRPTHVHARVGYRRGLAAVRAQIHGELQHRRVIASGRGKQQPLWPSRSCTTVTQVLALPELGLVDADQGYAAHVLLATGLGDVVLDAPPQLLGQRTRSMPRATGAHRPSRLGTTPSPEPRTAA